MKPSAGDAVVAVAQGDDMDSREPQDKPDNAPATAALPPLQPQQPVQQHGCCGRCLVRVTGIFHLFTFAPLIVINILQDIDLILASAICTGIALLLIIGGGLLYRGGYMRVWPKKFDVFNASLRGLGFAGWRGACHDLTDSSMIAVGRDAPHAHCVQVLLYGSMIPIAITQHEWMLTWVNVYTNAGNAGFMWVSHEGCATRGAHATRSAHATRCVAHSRPGGHATALTCRGPLNATPAQATILLPGDNFVLQTVRDRVPEALSSHRIIKRMALYIAAVWASALTVMTVSSIVPAALKHHPTNISLTTIICGYVFGFGPMAVAMIAQHVIAHIFRKRLRRELQQEAVAAAAAAAAEP